MKKIFLIVLPTFVSLLNVTAQNNVQYLKTGTQQTLSSGTIYRIPFDSLALDFSSSSNAVPLSVDTDATAAIELKEGQTLMVCGSHARNIMLDKMTYAPACPGILIPFSSNLIIYGDGEVIAYGGNATNGTKGQNGGNAEVGYMLARGGYGGAGGAGGAGAAPGIGGRGGIGGTNTAMVQPTIVDDPKMSCGFEEYEAPVAGIKGNIGQNGEDMGTLILLGNIKLTARSGNGGTRLQEYGLRGSNDNYRWRAMFLRNGFKGGYGGAGGNGGSGSKPDYDVGGGAPGAGSGGSGSAGGYMSQQNIDLDDLYFVTGEGGRGGYSLDSIHLSGRHGEGIGYDKNINGGTGGECGRHGSNGWLQYTTGVTLDCTSLQATTTWIESVYELPYDAFWIFQRKITGAIWEDESNEMELYYGENIPTTKVKPLSDNSESGLFLGYSDQYGKKVYDRDGCLTLDPQDQYRNFSYNQRDNTWSITCHDSVQLIPMWSGSRCIYVTRYMEDPNMYESKTGIKRYRNSDLYTYECFSIPVGYDGKTTQIPIYKDHEGHDAVDRSIYSYNADPDAETLTVDVPREGEAIIVQLDFDAKRHLLTWEGLDEEMMSRLCTNLNDYTRADSIPVGKAINFPAFRQAEGTAFDHWEAKTKSGTYVTFDEELMPDADMTLRPVFRQVFFQTDLSQSENAMVEIDKTHDIPYHALVTGIVHCRDSFRCNEVIVYGVESLQAVEVTFSDSTFSFTMPDEDVVIKVDIEYHPFCTLKAIMATEDGFNIDKIVYYVTKDWETFYTDNNDYYQFDSKSYGGTIREMSYSVGDIINVHSDFREDDGARQARVFIIKNKDGSLFMEDVMQRQKGNAEKTEVFFPFEVDSLMTATDIPLEILWTLPRYGFHIDIECPEDASVTAITATGRDISDNFVAYMDEQINFSVATTDTTFNTDNIRIAYENGYDLVTLDAGVFSENEDSLEFTFMMPESDLHLYISTGKKFLVIADAENDGYVIHAPTTAVAGTTVPCVIEYTDNCNIPEAQYLYVNGRRGAMLLDIDHAQSTVALANMKQYLWEETERIHRQAATFVMPEENVFVTLGQAGDPLFIAPAKTREANGDAIYNILGQKMTIKDTKDLQKGIYIIGEKKYIVK